MKVNCDTIIFIKTVKGFEEGIVVFSFKAMLSGRSDLCLHQNDEREFFDIFMATRISQAFTFSSETNLSSAR